MPALAVFVVVKQKTQRSRTISGRFSEAFMTGSFSKRDFRRLGT
jgi:hypothetical protein